MPDHPLHQVALRHAEAEAAGDFEATMATLEGEPVYELLPVGKRMVGRDAARRYYQNFFASVKPRLAGEAGGQMHGMWTGDTGTALEYTVAYRHDDGTVTQHRILGILTYGTTGLTGERVYADEQILRLMFAPLWDEMEDMPL